MLLVAASTNFLAIASSGINTDSFVRRISLSILRGLVVGGSDGACCSSYSCNTAMIVMIASQLSTLQLSSMFVRIPMSSQNNWTTASSSSLRCVHLFTHNPKFGSFSNLAIRLSREPAKSRRQGFINSCPFLLCRYCSTNPLICANSIVLSKQ